MYLLDLAGLTDQMIKCFTDDGSELVVHLSWFYDAVHRSISSSVNHTHQQDQVPAQCCVPGYSEEQGGEVNEDTSHGGE